MRSAWSSLGVRLPEGTDEEKLLASFGSSTRQLIRGAEKAGLRVLRYDGTSGDGPSAVVGNHCRSPRTGMSSS